MSTDFNININSEIGKLKGVILHTPGKEVKNMIPENASRALYSDILNIEIVNKEYSQFKGVLDKVTKTFEVKDLFADVIADANIKSSIISEILKNENTFDEDQYILSLSDKELTNQLFEGVLMNKNTVSKFLNKDRYSLKPLYNFFFTRDASISFGNKVIIGKMASPIRDRESLIMDYIFRNHNIFKANTINPNLKIENADLKIEGGDILIAREDILLVGMGARTNSDAIDFLISNIKQDRKTKFHILVQELPTSPESFIHLDMVFTLIDRDRCMVYSPLILKSGTYKTIHIELDEGKTKSITEENNLIEALQKLGMELKPIMCGGNADKWSQDREQWHSGANFFAFEPGKIIGYGRNINTINALNDDGFSVLKSEDVISGKVKIDDYKKCVVTIDGSELARGGGGARCMTMPIYRESVIW
jgi:arginine deiminase